jgi:hypothetical protein
MKKREWSEGIDHIDPALVEEYVETKDRLKKAKGQKRVWLRLGAVAACLLLVVSAVIILPMLREDDRGVMTPQDSTEEATSQDATIPVPDSEADPYKPIANLQIPSDMPVYYGSESSVGEYGAAGEINPSALSVTARLIETLPDTYTFFDDWRQYEFRLLRMETVKLLRGEKMTEEFYYLIPVEFMTDFSVFDCFVMEDMAQFSYEYAVMYNKTTGTAEQLTLVIFGYRVYGYRLMGEYFMAFDSDGNFDRGLWNANEAWAEQTQRVEQVATLEEAEQRILNDKSHYSDHRYAHSLENITGEAADVLAYMRSFENGIYVPKFSSMVHALSPEVQLHATRYINGFTTNEKISVWNKEWTGGDQDTYAMTKARFDENDLNTLPDLAAAIKTVAAAYDRGEIVPPHIVSYEELKLVSYGIFGWYAKTEEGVIGVVRVTWRYCFDEADDAYYVIEYGSDRCRPIDRDALLDMLGEYETTYIYTGVYTESGKDLSGIPYVNY